MTMVAVEGVYRNGKVELKEEPAGMEEAPVLVVFLPRTTAGAGGLEMSPEERERRRQAAFARMEQGIDLGGPPYPKREELYDRVRRISESTG
jgi:hypothetical protein